MVWGKCLYDLSAPRQNPDAAILRSGEEVRRARKKERIWMSALWRRRFQYHGTKFVVARSWEIVYWLVGYIF